MSNNDELSVERVVSWSESVRSLWGEAVAKGVLAEGDMDFASAGVEFMPLASAAGGAVSSSPSGAAGEKRS